MTILRAMLTIGFLLALLAAPFVAHAQQTGGLPRIGFLPLGSPGNAYDRSLVEAFRLGLRDVGLVENRHVLLDVVWSSEPDYARAVSELVQRGVRLLVPCGTSASLAAKRHAAGVPILFISVGNPVGIGLVESLSRPGGNTSGFSDVLADLGGKFVQFGQELGRPQAPLHYLWHTGWADGQYRLQASDAAAQAAGLRLRARGIIEVAEISDAIVAMKKDGATAVIVQPSPFTYRQRGRIIESATDNGLATIFGFPPAAREGALVAYGPDYAHLYRRAGSYVDRILKGTKPADLPVEEPRKFELVINLKVAKTLGITVPPSLLLQASEVIP